MMHTTNFLHGLNPEQHKAVTHDSGSLLVLAGAGSGKTKVLTTRIAWLVQNCHIGISEVLKPGVDVEKLDAIYKEFVTIPAGTQPSAFKVIPLADLKAKLTA